MPRPEAPDPSPRGGDADRLRGLVIFPADRVPTRAGPALGRDGGVQEEWWLVVAAVAVAAAMIAAALLLR